jgi:hypothetical protein
MRGEIDRILDRIADVLRQDKELLLEGVSMDAARANRVIRPARNSCLEPIADKPRRSLWARSAPAHEMTEADVHAQLQVYVPAIGAYAHVRRVEWRPKSPHTNSGNAPARLRFKTFHDRWYEFGVNRRLGIAALRQTAG